MSIKKNDLTNSFLLFFLRCQVHWQKQRRTMNSPENLLVKVDGKLEILLLSTVRKPFNRIVSL